MKLFDRLAQVISANTRLAFGLIGDGNVFMVDSFKRLGGNYVGAYHEANAVMAAFGHAYSTGEVGFVTVTHGPGIANTITALLETKKSNAPIVLLAGETPRDVPFHPQAIDQQKLIEGAGIQYLRVQSAAVAPGELDNAFKLAKQNMSPIVVGIPLDLMWESVPEPEVKTSDTAEPEVDAPDSRQIDDALGILASAKRPIVISGGGARGARDELIALAGALGAPLATTWQGKDQFLNEPANLGIFGTFSTPFALVAIDQADCLVFFGAALNTNTTANGTLLSGKAVVHVDLNGRAHGRYVNADVSVIGDSAQIAKIMRNSLIESGHEKSGFVNRVFGQGVSHQLREVAIDDAPEGTVNLAASLRYLDQNLTQERCAVMDVGLFEIHAMLEFHALDARSWVSAGNGFEAIGHGMGTALGVSSAHPDRKTVLLVGDGGLMMNGINELRRVAELGLNILCVVCNNSSYAAEHVQFTERGMDPAISHLDVPDFVSVAQAVGVKGFSVRSSSDLEAAMRTINGLSEPCLLDVHWHPDESYGIDL